MNTLLWKDIHMPIYSVRKAVALLTWVDPRILHTKNSFLLNVFLELKKKEKKKL